MGEGRECIGPGQPPESLSEAELLGTPDLTEASVGQDH